MPLVRELPEGVGILFDGVLEGGGEAGVGDGFGFDATFASRVGFGGALFGRCGFGAAAFFGGDFFAGVAFGFAAAFFAAGFTVFDGFAAARFC